VKKHETHASTREPISSGAAQLDSFPRFYFFIYIDVLQEK
jgi:hypothetical protein